MVRNIPWMPQEPEIEINPRRIRRIAPGNVCKYTSLLVERIPLTDEEIRSCTTSRYMGFVDPSVRGKHMRWQRYVLQRVRETALPDRVPAAIRPMFAQTILGSRHSRHSSHNAVCERESQDEEPAYVYDFGIAFRSTVPKVIQF